MGGVNEGPNSQQHASKEADYVRRTDVVVERAIALASGGRDEESSVRDLLEASMGKRVALVMARQQINVQAAAIGSDRSARALSLIDAAIATADLAD
jgi:hypothetical protein